MNSLITLVPFLMHLCHSQLWELDHIDSCKDISRNMWCGTVSWSWLINTYLISSFYGDGLKYGSTETDFLSDHMNGLNTQKTKWDFSASSVGSGALAGRQKQQNNSRHSQIHSRAALCHMRVLEAIRTAYIHKAYNLKSKLDSFGISCKESLKLCSTFWVPVCADRQELPMKDQASKHGIWSQVKHTACAWGSSCSVA